MERDKRGDGSWSPSEILSSFCYNPLPGRLGKVEFLRQLFSSDGPQYFPDHPLDFFPVFRNPFFFFDIDQPIRLIENLEVQCLFFPWAVVMADDIADLINHFFLDT